MKIALTGASGRIGNVLVRQLLETGHDLRVLQRRDSRALAGLPLERIQGDLFDPEALLALTKDCEVLFHLAAVISMQGDRKGYLQYVNVEGTRRVLEASRQQGTRRVVYFGSVHAFREGAADTLFDESRPLALDSRSAYNRSKAEALALAFRFVKDLDVIALCPTGVLGPFDYEPSLSGQMLLDFYRQKIPLLVPGGFDWVDVRDVAQAAVAALHRGRSGEAYLLPGTYLGMTELAQLIGQVTGKPVPRQVTPDWLLRLGLPFVGALARLTGARPLYTGEALDTLRDGSKKISSEKARLAFGYSARPLAATLADAYAWFKQNAYL